MECENSIKSIINNDINNDINNKYKIESKLLNRIKYRCSCDEPGDLPHYKHQNLKLSFDFSNYKLTQYINNNEELGLLELYKKYVENFHTNLIHFKKKNDKNLNEFYKSIEYLENQEEIYYLEEQIKNLIINLCYIKINDYVKKNYNTECYFIYDFNLDIKFVDDLCKYIYFNHYIDNDKFSLNHNSIPAIGYFINKQQIYNFIKKLAYVNISGDIYYKQK